MPEFHVRHCSCEQHGALSQNMWKYTQVKGEHIRICQGTADVPVIPPGSVNCTAKIEVLEAVDTTWGKADAEAQRVVEDLFSDVL